MKKFYYLFVILFLNIIFFELNAQFTGNVIKTISKIDNIIIYNSGATVNRIGLVNLKKGTNKIFISNLSPKLISESIQFNVKSNDVIINSISKQANFLGNSFSNTQVIYIEDSIQRIDESIREKTVNLEVYNQGKDLLDQNKSVLKTSREFIIDDLMDLTEYFNQKIKEIQINISKVNKEILDLKKIKTSLKKQLNSIKSNVNNQVCDIVIQLTCSKDGEFNYELNYNTMQAGWVPSYDFRVKEINSPIKLTYKAKVYQNTNEEWSDIQLSLSTGQLNKSNKAPNFNPQIIRNTTNYRKDTRYSNKSISSMSIEMNDSEDEPNEKSLSSSEYTSVDFSGTQIKYNISLPYSIPSQKSPIFIEIQQLNLNANYDYYCYPKVDKDVFLMCHFEKLSNKNFLPGIGQVYFAGKSIGSTYLDPFSIKKTIDLSLSRDVSIIVERILETKLSSESKVGDNIKIEKSYKITLKNNKNKAVNLVLIDQIPVSNKKSIEVQLMESSEAKHSKNNGKLVWNLKLNPEEIVVKKFSFSVKHPEKDIIYNF